MRGDYHDLSAMGGKDYGAQRSTPPQPEEGLRAALKELRCIGKINGEVMEYTVHLPDNHVDAILQLFQSTMLSCEPTITMEDIDIPLPTLEEYQKMVWILDLNNRFWRANILKACGDKTGE